MEAPELSLSDPIPFSELLTQIVVLSVADTVPQVIKTKQIAINSQKNLLFRVLFLFS